MRALIGKTLYRSSIAWGMLLLCSCALTSREKPHVKNESSPPKWSIAEPERIFFRPGHPYIGESLEEALATPSQEDKLKNNLLIVTRFLGINGYRVETIGSTDNRE